MSFGAAVSLIEIDYPGAPFFRGGASFAFRSSLISRSRGGTPLTERGELARLLAASRIFGEESWRWRASNFEKHTCKVSGISELPVAIVSVMLFPIAQSESAIARSSVEYFCASIASPRTIIRMIIIIEITSLAAMSILKDSSLQGSPRVRFPLSQVDTSFRYILRSLR